MAGKKYLIHVWTEGMADYAVAIDEEGNRGAASSGLFRSIAIARAIKKADEVANIRHFENQPLAETDWSKFQPPSAVPEKE